MTAEAALLVREFPVGKRTVTMTIPRPRCDRVVSMAAEWDPDLPKRLSVREWRQYRAGRDAALAEVGQLLGGGVGVVAEL